MAFRFDRFTTLLIVDPFLRAWTPATYAIPILMYHSISDVPETGLHPYYRINTSPDVFARHMNFLRSEGYKSCTLTDALQHLERGSEIDKLVVITFDDGYADFYRSGFPELSRNGLGAIVFLPTAHIGDRHISFKGRDCLSWKEIAELRQYGISFGSHTVSHPQLHALGDQEIKDELENSRDVIEQKLGSAVESFAYPYAFPETDSDFRARLRTLLVSAGYKNGVCTIIGRATSHSDPYFLKRLPANTCDDIELFRAKLTGAYDWLAKPQYLRKVAKQWIDQASSQ